MKGRSRSGCPIAASSLFIRSKPSVTCLRRSSSAQTCAKEVRVGIGQLLEVRVQTAGERVEQPGVHVKLLTLARDDPLRRVLDKLLVCKLALSAFQLLLGARDLPPEALYLAAAHLVREQNIDYDITGWQRRAVRAVKCLYWPYTRKRHEDFLVCALGNEPVEFAVDPGFGPERAHGRDGPLCTVEQPVRLLVFERGIVLREALRREQLLLAHNRGHLLSGEGHDGMKEPEGSVEDLTQDAGC